MSSAKNVAIVSIFTALLIAVQLALSFVSGVEIVTVLMLAFCYVYGTKRGMCVATAFSLIRCLIFGAFLNVIALYLLYYNLFAIIIGYIGKNANKSLDVKKHIVLIVVAVLLTISFTLLDDILTPIFYTFSIEVALSYAYASLTTLIPHVICAILTVGLLFPILYKVCIKFSD